MGVLFRFLIPVMMLVATYAAYGAGERTGDYFGVAIVLSAAVAYWFVESRPAPGTVLYAFRFLFIRSLSALLVVLLGIVGVVLAVSELWSPVVFFRPSSNVLAQAFRDLFGSIGLSALLGAIGVALIIQGLRRMPGFKTGASHE